MSHSAFIAGRWIVACAVTILAALGRSEAGEGLFTDPFPQSEREQPQPVLKTPESIPRLTRQEAARAHRAVIRGVVTCSLPESESVVIQYATRGIYVDRINSIVRLRNSRQSPPVARLLPDPMKNCLATRFAGAVRIQGLCLQPLSTACLLRVFP
jgi:hypothetical protein